MKSLRLSLFLLAACGAAPGSFEGTLGKQAFTVRDAVLLGGRDAQGNLSTLGIVLSDQPGLCDALAKGKVQASTVEMLLSANGVPGVGAYAVGATTGNRAQVQGRMLGKATVAATSGAVSVASLETGAHATVSGSFDLTFETQEHARGTFTAPVCVVTADLGIQKVEEHQLSLCDALQSFTERFAAKQSACLMGGLTNFDRASCEQAAPKCSPEDRAKTDELIACFDSVPACTKGGEMALAQALIPCLSGLGAIKGCGF